MVRPVSLGVEAAVVMSDTSYGVHSGLVCGSSSLQAGDSTRGLGESGVKARVSLLSRGSVVGVSLLLAGDTELSRSVGGLTTALLFITACSSKNHLKFTKISSSSPLSIPTTALPQLVNFILVLLLQLFYLCVYLHRCAIEISLLQLFSQLPPCWSLPIRA